MGNGHFFERVPTPKFVQLSNDGEVALCVDGRIWERIHQGQSDSVWRRLDIPAEVEIKP